MAAQLTDIQKMIGAVKGKIGEASEMEDGEIEAHIYEALSEYSNDRPRVVVESFNGDGSTYSFTLTYYAERFTSVYEVEYPGGSQTPVKLKDNDYEIYRGVSTTQLRLHRTVPATGETVIVRYTALHSITSLTSTIPEFDERAFVNLAAARCCTTLAAKYLPHARRDRSPQALEFRSKIADFQGQSRRYLSAYQRHIGSGIEADPTAYTTNVDLDVNLGVPGDRIFHSRNWR